MQCITESKQVPWIWAHRVQPRAETSTKLRVNICIHALSEKGNLLVRNQWLSTSVRVCILERLYPRMRNRYYFKICLPPQRELYLCRPKGKDEEPLVRIALVFEEAASKRLPEGGSLDKAALRIASKRLPRR